MLRTCGGRLEIVEGLGPARPNSALPVRLKLQPCFPSFLAEDRHCAPEAFVTKIGRNSHSPEMLASAGQVGLSRPGPQPKNEGGAVDYAQLFESNFGVVKQMAYAFSRRSRLSDTDTDEFYGRVVLKLIENDYFVLRQFEGNSSLKAYLATVVRNALADYTAHMWGKWRPSAEALRQGTVGVLLDRLTSRDGLSFDEAAEQLITNHRVTESHQTLYEMWSQLPLRYPRRHTSNDEFPEVVSDEPRQDELMLRREEAASASAAITKTLAAWPSQDRLIVLLRFVHGLQVATIAKRLALDPVSLYPRCKRLFRQLASALELHGVSAGRVHALIESDEIGPVLSESSTSAAAAAIAKGQVGRR